MKSRTYALLEFRAEDRRNSAAMLRVLIFLISLGARAIRAMCRRRDDLVMENLVLRQQVTAPKKERPRPLLEDVDRAFWVALLASWPSWASRLVIVHADTVARWNRDRLRRHWAKISQRRNPGRPRVDAEIRRHLGPQRGLQLRGGRVHQIHGHEACSHLLSHSVAERNRGALDRQLPSRSPRARRFTQRAPSRPARARIHQAITTKTVATWVSARIRRTREPSRHVLHPRPESWLYHALVGCTIATSGGTPRKAHFVTARRLAEAIASTVSVA